MGVHFLIKMERFQLNIDMKLEILFTNQLKRLGISVMNNL